MPVNAVMPNPLRQPRATMSLLVPLSSALGLPCKCLVWPTLTFFGEIRKDLFIKHVRERNCFRVSLSSAKIGPSSLSDVSLHSQRQKALKVSKFKRKRFFKKKGSQWDVNVWRMELKTYSFLHSITGGGKLSHRSSTDWPFNNHVHKSYGAKLDLAHLTKTSLIFNLLEEDCFKVLF